MLGENKERLMKLRLPNNLHPSEIDLINFVLKNDRLPNFVDDKKYYLILRRLHKKLNESKGKVMVISSILDIFNNIKVSNKLVGGDVS